MDHPSPDAHRARDWTSQYRRAVIWWWAPAGMAIGAGFFHLSHPARGLIWAAAFAWMGAGCALNARRCGRRHCYFSGPAFGLGALGAALSGFRVLPVAHPLNHVVWGTIVLVAASYLPEAFWGKYVRMSPSDRVSGSR